ncbi:MAG: type I methionyl aminopeptidase [Candidatus Portnoybacteria bacterium CG03_land_8_20_14_0_80_41_10]|uniref:Methionine aminopeptidase n=1 Tax=Candidatus Portnoybacteria bacterium CG03_land_8_20_14_0_80_41_10 TaxID=1974808 RepID=A0A2M7BU61_9BACT|nr:MAG: type I methionyl aminopeptidase [Candidatus Portnoybacteria bacterium CG03_land_8_20_14_0_80_41_10]
MIHIKSPEEVELMAQAGRLLAKVMRQLKDAVKPGLTTESLDKLAEEIIFSYGAKPAFKGYGGFPNTLCASINEQIVHGVPSKRQIKEGDILSLDTGLIYQGFYADMAVTLPVGPISKEAQKLIQVTKKALRKAIARVKPGQTIGDISFAIQKHIQAEGFQVVKELCGHGIGRNLHEDPDVPNFGYPHKGPILKEGAVIAIEPMAVLGQPGIKKGPDGFCYQTADNSLSAHFENTVAATKKGPRILTE